MACQSCGEACQGQLCSTCSTMEHQEARYGLPSDHIEDDASLECSRCGFPLLAHDSRCPECGRWVSVTAEVADGD